MNDRFQVLFVEDDTDIRAVAQLALEDEGFKLTLCSSGQEAVDKAISLTVDLILLDVMMPDLDGPSTLLKLREFPHLANTPTIFMTAKVQHSEVKKYYAMGAVGVIAKPFDPMTLANEIREKLIG